MSAKQSKFKRKMKNCIYLLFVQHMALHRRMIWDCQPLRNS